MIRKHDGQVWQLDFLFAIVVVVLAVGIFISFATQSNTHSAIFEMTQVASSMSQVLLTQGLPEKWDTGSVKVVGLTDGTPRLNNTKLFYLYNLTADELRPLFGEEFKYQISLYKNGERALINGKAMVGFNSSNAENAIAIRRLVLYNTTISELEVIIWS